MLLAAGKDSSADGMYSELQTAVKAGKVVFSLAETQIRTSDQISKLLRLSFVPLTFDRVHVSGAS